MDDVGPYRQDDVNVSLKHAMARTEAIAATADANFTAARDVEDSVRKMESEHAAALAGAYTRPLFGST